MGNYNKGYRKSGSKDRKNYRNEERTSHTEELGYLKEKSRELDHKDPLYSEEETTNDQIVPEFIFDILEPPKDKIQRKVYYINIIVISILCILVFGTIYLLFFKF